MKYRHVQNAFTSGELHPRLDGRTDLEEYATGVDTLQNFTTFRQGGISRRMGSRYVSTITPTATTSYVGLIPFIFSKKESYNIAIEIKSSGAVLRIKVFDSEGTAGTITTSLDDPSGYAAYKDIPISGNTSDDFGVGRGLENLTTDVNNFSYAQSADLLIVTHNSGRIRPLVIARTASNKFYISNMQEYFWSTAMKQTLHVPYEDTNTDSNRFIQVAGSGSSVSLAMYTASGGSVGVPFFSADTVSGHHGAYFSVRNSDEDECFRANYDGFPTAITVAFSTSAATATSHVLLTGDIVHASGNLPSPLVADTDYYIIKHDANTIKLATSLANARSTTVLSIADGTTGTVLTPKFVAKITATDVGTAAGSYSYYSDVWRESSFSNYRGYPRAVTVFEQRLIFGGTIARPDTLYGSMTGNFFHFMEERLSNHSWGENTGEYEGSAVATDPFQFTIASQEVNEITWLAPRTHLEVGTLGTEYIVSGGDTAISSITPPVIKPQTSHGSSPIMARKIEDSTVFISRDGKLLREFKYNNDNGSYISRNLSVSAEHIVSHLFDGDSSDASSGIEILQFAYQASKGIIWCLTTRNALIGLTLDSDTGTAAWHKHEFGGSTVRINSISVIPNSTGTHDDLYLSISRLVEGNTVHYLEKIGEDFSHTKLKNSSTSDDDQAYFSDSSKRIKISTVTTTFGSVSSNAAQCTADHNLATGTKVRLSTTGTLPTDGATSAALSTSTDYYLIKKDANELYLASTAKNAFAHINLTLTGGSGTHTITPVNAYIFPGFTHLDKEAVEVLSDGFYEQEGYSPSVLTVLYNKVDGGNNRINLVYSGNASTVIPHYLVTGTEIYYKSFANAAIGGITENTTYYVIREDDNYFKLASSYANAIAGTHISLTTSGISSGHYEFYPSNAPTIIDENGNLMLKDPATEVIAGLKYVSTVKTMKLEAGAQFGSAQGSIKRNDSIVLRFQGTYGGKFGIATNENNLEEIVFRPAGHGMGSDLPLFTGDKFLDFPGDYERFFQIIVEQDKPMPMNLLAIVHRGVTYD